MMTSEERKIMIELEEIGDRLKEIYFELEKDNPESATHVEEAHCEIWETVRILWRKKWE